jgi:hypothetical protein
MVDQPADTRRLAALPDVRDARTRLAELKAREAPVECQLTLDPWLGTLILARLKQYGVEPFRYAKQRVTTIMVRVPPTFADEILMPDLERLSKTGQAYFADATQRLVADLCPDVSLDSLEVRILKDSANPPK